MTKMRMMAVTSNLVCNGSSYGSNFFREMSLPASFSSPCDYFHAAISFLKTHAWIYQHSNTSFLRMGVLNTFPPDYIDYFMSVSNDELNRFPFVYEDEELVGYSSKNLGNFRRSLKKLIPEEAFRQPPEVDFKSKSYALAPNMRRLNAKKRYEMSLLPPLIAELCGNGITDVLIDFGSGLGYLSECVHQLNPQCRIVGLEADQYRVETAQKRLREYLPHANGAIVYKREFITEASSNYIITNAQELVNGKEQATLKMGIMGLHACADLSITSMRLFLRMPMVRRLVIMPCCYHKLQMSVEGRNNKSGSDFVNFPLSACLKDVIASDDDDVLSQRCYLNRPFLRLACQQSCMAWRSCSTSEHEAHGREMFRRAVADAIIVDDMKEAVVKLKRKVHVCQVGEKKEEDLEQTFAGLCLQYELISKESQLLLPWTHRHEEKFNEINQRYAASVGHKLAEGLTCLQTAMQKLCENIVLYDRLCYMRECAATENLQINVCFEKLLNEKLSPRCYVLIAEKL